jgi:hypothetical protein
MVPVNKKPQYLVFCLHSPHLPSKYRQLPVESSKDPCATRTRASQLCPKFDATAACPVFSTPDSSLAPAKSARKTQKRCRFPVPLCELWTFGAIQDHSKSAEPFMTRIAAWPASSAGAERERSTTHPVGKGKRPRAFHAQSVEDRGEWNRILDRAKGSLPVVQSSPEGLESIALSGLFPRSSRYTVQAT